MLYKYFKGDMKDLEPEIISQLDDKFNKLIIRDLYSDFLNASSPEEKELAKEQYLEAKGISKNFRY